MLADSVQSRYAEDADAAVVVTVCIASRAIAGRCSGRNPSSCTAAQIDMRFLSPFQPLEACGDNAQRLTRASPLRATYPYLEDRLSIGSQWHAPEKGISYLTPASA